MRLEETGLSRVSGPRGAISIRNVVSARSACIGAATERRRALRGEPVFVDQPASDRYSQAEARLGSRAVIVRCTGKLLNLLGKHSVALVDAPATSDDWYANLLWVDRRKCLLIVHGGTLFALFAADVRVGDLRPFEPRIVDLLAAELLEEGLPTDTRSAA